VAAVVLAVVFGWAAVAKLVRHRDTVVAFRELGLPVPRLLAVLVPGAELVVAACLLLRPDVGAVVALAALVVFTAVVVRAVLRGSTGGCGCFGSRRVDPVSLADVLRNGLLAALGVIATGTAALVSPGVVELVAVVAATTVGAVMVHIARPRLSGSPTTGRGGARA